MKHWAIDNNCTKSYYWINFSQLNAISMKIWNYIVRFAHLSVNDQINFEYYSLEIDPNFVLQNVLLRFELARTAWQRDALTVWPSKHCGWTTFFSWIISTWNEFELHSKFCNGSKLSRKQISRMPLHRHSLALTFQICPTTLIPFRSHVW